VQKNQSKSFRSLLKKLTAKTWYYLLGTESTNDEEC